MPTDHMEAQAMSTTTCNTDHYPAPLLLTTTGVNMSSLNQDWYVDAAALYMYEICVQ